MAKKVNVELVDDIDPDKVADETVTFSIDGADYEIDLSTVNADKLRKALQPWVSAARRPQRAPRRLTRSTSGGATRNREQTAAIRAWANANGYTVGSKGRIPVEIEDAYNSRTPATPSEDQAPAMSAAKKARVAKALANAEAKVAAAKNES